MVILFLLLFFFTVPGDKLLSRVMYCILVSQVYACTVFIQKTFCFTDWSQHISQVSPRKHCLVFWDLSLLYIKISVYKDYISTSGFSLARIERESVTYKGSWRATNSRHMGVLTNIIQLANRKTSTIMC